MRELVIRPAQTVDVEQLAALAKRAVMGSSSGFYGSEQTLSAAECITTPDLELIADGTLLVAVIENRIVGCGAWSKRKKLYTGSKLAKGSSNWLNPTSDPARIRAFFVDPDFGRQGIARRLYESCRDQARAEGFTRFELMATLPGVPLYNSLGFSTEEEVELDLVDGSKLPAIRISSII